MAKKQRTDDAERRDVLREIELTTQRINELNKAAATAAGSELRDLENRMNSEKIRLQMNQRALADLNSIKRLTKDNLKNFDDIDDTLSSIGGALKNNSVLQDAFTSKLKSTKETLTSIATIVEASEFDDKQLAHIDAAGKAYSNMNTSIANAASNLHNGKITQQEYNEIVRESVKAFDELVSLIDTSTAAGKDLVATFMQGRKELESFKIGAERSTSALEGMNGAIDQLGSSGIPLAREFSNVLGDVVNTGKLGKAALIAMGAAAGKLAYDYFAAPVQAGVQAAYDVEEAQIQGAQNVAQAQHALSFAAQKAASDFGFQLQQLAAQFSAASKTALFGKGLGSVGYAASQLQLAGISAETIANATMAASKSGNGSPKLAADMAIFAERSGISVDNLANVQQAFKLLDGVSSGTALNMAEGTRAMAEQAGLNVGDIMNEVASASEMALSYQIQSGAALARQVVYAKSLGVSFNEVAKAGQDMVLNYKDSIKAEMSLSAMLGKNVDLSEVRAKFASGDQEGALKALQAQGLDPSQMNMFQQQQLQSALGGMDLNTLQKIATPGYQEDADIGKVGKLEEKSAKASNDAYLTLKQSAEAALATQQAMLAGQKAVKDAAIAALEDASFKNSLAYIEYVAAMEQLKIRRGFGENTGGALAAGAGALLMNFLPDLLFRGKGKGMMKGLGSLFGKGKGASQFAGGSFSAGKSILASGGKGGAGFFAKLLGGGGKMAAGAGGAATGGILSGVFGSITGYFDRKEQGADTAEAAGAGLLQGTAATSGAVLGGLLGSIIPGLGTAIGAMIGGFLGDSLGSWINSYAPDVAKRFGDTWNGVTEKFNAMKEKIQPVLTMISNAWDSVKSAISGVYNKVNEFMVGLGFEKGLGSIFSFLAEFIGNNLMQPFNILLSAFGFLFDIIGGVAQLTYDWNGGIATLKQGFLDFMHSVIAPFIGLFETIYNGFAKMWNGIVDYLPESAANALGIEKMAQQDFSALHDKAMNQTEAAAAKASTSSVSTQIQQKSVEAAQQPVVEATTAATKVAEESAAYQEAMLDDLMYAGDIQNKMVALLGASAILLEEIVYNTAGTRTISLDGKVLNKKLFDNSTKTYALAKV